jgi:hypothetical protein
MSDIMELLNVSDERQDKETQAQMLIRLVLESGVELFHNPDQEAFAEVSVNGHREVWPVGSRGFRLWLYGKFYDSFNKTPSAQAFADARGVLEAQAFYKGSKVPVNTRIAGHNGNVYVDLCNDVWQVVEVTPIGWRILDRSPVKFRRTKGMLAIPVPEHGGRIDDLKPFVNVESEDDFKLIVAWLIAAFHPSGPYPLLTLQGEQGSAKSTTSRVVKDLIDPSTTPLRSFPRDERDLAIAASNGWVLAYDNLSGLSSAMSDALCKLATGGGFGTRQLYENNEEMLFNFKRPVIVNGIDDIATRQDMVSRSILQNLPAIPEEKRQDEGSFWALFESVKSKLLGAILTAVSGALRELPGVKLERLPRMADFAKWVTAAESALGWTEGSFMKAYMRNINVAIDQGLDSMPFATAVIAFMGMRDSWQGTVSDFLRSLLTDDRTRNNQKLWPAPNKAKGWLKRIAAALRHKGIRYIDLPKSNQGAMLQLYKIADISSQPSQSSQTAPDQRFFSDDANRVWLQPSRVSSLRLRDSDDRDCTSDDSEEESSLRKPRHIKENDYSDGSDDTSSKYFNDSEWDAV